ncbi:MAG: hypothetical protein MJ252_15430 [archaeon]|nr:hypothetical protein [archaeon]
MENKPINMQLKDPNHPINSNFDHKTYVQNRRKDLPIKINKEDEERKELHNNIDSVFDSMIKDLDKLFNSLKVSEKPEYAEVSDLEMSVSIENIANSIEVLLKLANQIKIKSIINQNKIKEASKKEAQAKEQRGQLVNLMNVCAKINHQMLECIKDWKNNRIYKQYLSICEDKKE